MKMSEWSITVKMGSLCRRIFSRRIRILAFHKEYDHMLQPISQKEYLMAAILRLVARSKDGNRDAL